MPDLVFEHGLLDPLLVSYNVLGFFHNSEQNVELKFLGTGCLVKSNTSNAGGWGDPTSPSTVVEECWFSLGCLSL